MTSDKSNGKAVPTCSSSNCRVNAGVGITAAVVLVATVTSWALNISREQETYREGLTKLTNSSTAGGLPPDTRWIAGFAYDGPATIGLVEAVRLGRLQHALDLCEQHGRRWPWQSGVLDASAPVINLIAMSPISWQPMMEKLMRCALRNGAHINLDTPAYPAPLISASRAKNLPLMEALLRHGAHVHLQRSGSQTTPLHAAMCCVHSSGAAQNVFGSDEQFEAVRQRAQWGIALLEHIGEPQFASELLDTLNEWEQTRQQQGRAGHNAYVSFSARQLNLWTQSAVNVATSLLLNATLAGAHGDWQNSRDASGSTPLHDAARSGNPVAAKLLLRSKPGTVNDLDSHGATALDIALRLGHVDVCGVLQRFQGRAALPVSPRIPAASRVEYSPDTGGWSTQVPEGHATERCDIDERVNLTAQQFYEEYFSIGKPVILRGVGANWSERAAWTKADLLEKYGDDSFQIGHIPYPQKFGLPVEYVSLRTYVDSIMSKQTAARARSDEPGQTQEEGMYIFTAIEVAEHATQHLMQEDYKWRPHFLQSEQFDAMLLRSGGEQFFVGGPGTGAPVHYHSDAINHCAYGMRRWFLWQPGHAFYSNKPMSYWVRDDLPQSLGTDVQPLECTQHGSDVLFVPRDWAHATYNLQESVGIAVELMNDRIGVCQRGGILVQRVHGDLTDAAERIDNELQDVCFDSLAVAQQIAAAPLEPYNASLARELGARPHPDVVEVTVG